jgi:uncharacterized protein
VQLIDDGSLILSASDVTSHLSCAHLVQQKLAAAQGKRGALPVGTDPHATLIQARGDAHEAEQLEKLRAGVERFIDLSTQAPSTDRAALEAGVGATVAAMRDGADLIYQAPLFDGRRRGIADFLRRVPGDSSFGDYAYEVVDVKLARQVKPHFVHQLCFYSELLAATQNGMPEHAHVILGDGTSEPIELGRYAALHRHVIAQLEDVVSSPPQETYPEPVAHCDVCDWWKMITSAWWPRLGGKTVKTWSKRESRPSRHWPTRP